LPAFPGKLSGAFRASFPAPLRPGQKDETQDETGQGRKKGEKSFASHYALAREAAGFEFLPGLTLLHFAPFVSASFQT